MAAFARIPAGMPTRLIAQIPAGRLLGGGLLALLAGCATQGPVPTQMPRPVPPTVVTQAVSADQAMLRNLVNYQDRLYRVSGPLLTSNPELCKGNNARKLFGFTAKNKYSWSPELA